MAEKKLTDTVSKTEIKIGDIKAGRTSPYPSFSLKPKIIVKPKDDNGK